jgi:cell division protein FtsQ
MDDRGRELQQIETGSRFWWRALDAQTPAPVTSQTVQHATHASTYASSSFSTWVQADNSLVRGRNRGLPDAGFTLQIPRSDRRRQNRARRPKSKFKSIVAMGLCLSGVAGAAALGAVTTNEETVSRLKQTLREATLRAVVAAGFGIDQVSLTGQRFTLDSDVYDALDLRHTTTFAELDTAAALKRIERIAWVDTAQITRVFPGNLNIAIKERVPAAVWSRGNMSYLIDATGRTLGPLPESHTWKLPRIVGEGASSEASLLLTSLARHSSLMGQFDHAERIAERRWSVVLKNATRIELGADREVEGLDEVATNTLLKQAVSEGGKIIDVRMSGRAIVRAQSMRGAAQHAAASQP